MRKSMLVVGVSVLCALAANAEESTVSLPKTLFACLVQEYQDRMLEIPFQAKRWAEELSADGELELKCHGKVWKVRVE